MKTIRENRWRERSRFSTRERKQSTAEKTSTCRELPPSGHFVKHNFGALQKLCVLKKVLSFRKVSSPRSTLLCLGCEERRHKLRHYRYQSFHLHSLRTYKSPLQQANLSSLLLHLCRQSFSLSKHLHHSCPFFFNFWPTLLHHAFQDHFYGDFYPWWHHIFEPSFRSRALTLCQQ